MARTTIPKMLKWQVFERDRYTCRYCGATGIPLEVDHVYPDSRGGPTVIENLVAACEKCNREKGSKLGIYPLPVDYARRLAYANRIIGWYQAEQENVIKAEVDQKLAEKLDKLEKWYNRREREFRLIKLIPRISLIILAIGCILILLGIFAPYPLLPLIGWPIFLSAFALSMAYPRLVRWHTRESADIPNFY